jgi:MFS family permease
VLLGAGTAMVYPTLIAAVSDATEPRERARAVGVYRFWRDVGFVLGALVAGVAADVASSEAAILIVTALTAASGLAVLATRWPARPTLHATGEAAVRAFGAADVLQRGRIRS